MLSVSEARERILQGLRATAPEIVSLSCASGRVSASPVFARLDNPPADISAMDGYAVRAADLSGDGVQLRLIGESPAGHPFGGTVGAGECVRIYTGSIVPAGADAIVLQENASRHDDIMTTTQVAQAGLYVRRRGQDFAHGREIIPSGRRLDARAIGLAAAANHPWLSVYRRPRVAIVATGDELVLPGEPMGPGMIANSNTLMLEALIRAAGAEPVMMPVARDRMEDLIALSRMVEGMDMLVTIGGASVGRYDLVQEALKRIGVEMDFWKIAMRPGKPLMHGRLGAMPVIGLPGNPVAAFVCGTLFVAPALRRLMGQDAVGPEIGMAILGADVEANDQRESYLRARLRHDAAGRLIALPFPQQDSAMLQVLCDSQALVIRDAKAAPARKGDACRIIRLDIP
ncbi:molybdopterin molybdotransferase MoeA [Gluconacetobacter entanii]|uniref:Molybdopterin molybdenumtransferase n=1 Tax=Gluconacetobacter entanii TaxID=108528 RepID=A0A318PVE8_9PROT|nr:gephyrin-like molybdotransferase Glp [Gluconacetobacter entanii]MCE2577632.1 molybdopterin molybdotransferase MoeA [Komagataeibacter sp. FNDCR1]PYD64169.1 molybdopterin molybdenumtransferase MoeA [Gluconacetobacter entanii]